MSTQTPAPAKQIDPNQVRLIGVRLSYPNLFVARKGKGDKKEGTAKFSASYLLDKKKDAVQIASVQKVIDAILLEKNKGVKLAPDKICMRDGSFKPGADGYGDDIVFITSSNSKRPRVVDKNSVKDALGKLVDITEESGRIYGGMYVNATIRLWWQDNEEGGKRINASLEAIQYYKEGERFGADPVDVDDAFDGIEDAQEDAIPAGASAMI